MCTVSWVHQPGGYHLLCNRDEKRTRGRALAPRLIERSGVRYVAPVDLDSGGTWLAANEFGLSICLLNSAEASPAAERQSRGLIIPELAAALSAGECVWRMKRLGLRPFAPFTAVILEPGQQATLAHWDGRQLDIDLAGDVHMPLTSSSYDPPGVRRARLQEFARRADPAGAIDPALLYWFHSSHGSAPDAYSVCMHRQDAETVSFSWVIVTQSAIRFLYSPAPLCRCAPSQQQVLLRAA